MDPSCAGLELWCHLSVLFLVQGDADTLSSMLKYGKDMLSQVVDENRRRWAWTVACSHSHQHQRELFSMRLCSMVELFVL